MLPLENVVTKVVHIERGKRRPKTGTYKPDLIKDLIDKGPNGDKELHSINST